MATGFEALYPALGQLTYFLTLTFLGLGAGIGIYFYWMYSQFSIKVEINEQRGDGSYIVRFDRARRITQGGFVRYRLMKSKTDIRPPDNLKQVYLHRRGDYLKLIKVGENYFSFGKVNEPDLDPIPMDMEFWKVNMHEEALRRHRRLSFWEKYGNTISLMLFAALFAITLIAIVKEFKETSTVLAEASKILAEAARGGQIVG